jgi:hypothetical protein
MSLVSFLAVSAFVLFIPLSIDYHVCCPAAGVSEFTGQRTLRVWQTELGLSRLGWEVTQLGQKTGRVRTYGCTSEGVG